MEDTNENLKLLKAQTHRKQQQKQNPQTGYRFQRLELFLVKYCMCNWNCRI